MAAPIGRNFRVAIFVFIFTLCLTIYFQLPNRHYGNIIRRISAIPKDRPINVAAFQRSRRAVPDKEKVIPVLKKVLLDNQGKVSVDAALENAKREINEEKERSLGQKPLSHPVKSHNHKMHGHKIPTLAGIKKKMSEIKNESAKAKKVEKIKEKIVDEAAKNRKSMREKLHSVIDKLRKTLIRKKNKKKLLHTSQPKKYEPTTIKSTEKPRVTDEPEGQVKESIATLKEEARNKLQEIVADNKSNSSKIETPVVQTEINKLDEDKKQHTTVVPTGTKDISVVETPTKSPVTKPSKPADLNQKLEEVIDKALYPNISKEKLEITSKLPADVNKQEVNLAKLVKEDTSKQKSEMSGQQSKEGQELKVDANELKKELPNSTIETNAEVPVKTTEKATNQSKNLSSKTNNEKNKKTTQNEELTDANSEIETAIEKAIIKNADKLKGKLSSKPLIDAKKQLEAIIEKDLIEDTDKQKENVANKHPVDTNKEIETAIEKALIKDKLKEKVPDKPMIDANKQVQTAIEKALVEDRNKSKAELTNKPTNDAIKQIETAIGDALSAETDKSKAEILHKPMTDGKISTETAEKSLNGETKSTKSVLPVPKKSETAEKVLNLDTEKSKAEPTSVNGNKQTDKIVNETMIMDISNLPSKTKEDGSKQPGDITDKKLNAETNKANEIPNNAETATTVKPVLDETSKISVITPPAQQIEIKNALDLDSVKSKAEPLNKPVTATNKQVEDNLGTQAEIPKKVENPVKEDKNMPIASISKGNLTVQTDKSPDVEPQASLLGKLPQAPNDELVDKTLGLDNKARKDDQNELNGIPVPSAEQNDKSAVTNKPTAPSKLGIEPSVDYPTVNVKKPLEAVDSASGTFSKAEMSPNPSIKKLVTEQPQEEPREGLPVKPTLSSTLKIQAKTQNETKTGNAQMEDTVYTTNGLTNGIQANVQEQPTAEKSPKLTLKELVAEKPNKLADTELTAEPPSGTTSSEINGKLKDKQTEKLEDLAINKPNIKPTKLTGDVNKQKKEQVGTVSDMNITTQEDSKSLLSTATATQDLNPQKPVAEEQSKLLPVETVIKPKVEPTVKPIIVNKPLDNVLEQPSGVKTIQPQTGPTNSAGDASIEEKKQVDEASKMDNSKQEDKSKIKTTQNVGVQNPLTEINKQSPVGALTQSDIGLTDNVTGKSLGVEHSVVGHKTANNHVNKSTTQSGGALNNLKVEKPVKTIEDITEKQNGDIAVTNPSSGIDNIVTETENILARPEGENAKTIPLQPNKSGKKLNGVTMSVFGKVNFRKPEEQVEEQELVDELKRTEKLELELESLEKEDPASKKLIEKESEEEQSPVEKPSDIPEEIIPDIPEVTSLAEKVEKKQEEVKREKEELNKKMEEISEVHHAGDGHNHTDHFPKAKVPKLNVTPVPETPEDSIQEQIDSELDREITELKSEKEKVKGVVKEKILEDLKELELLKGEELQKLRIQDLNNLVDQTEKSEAEIGKKAIKNGKPRKHLPDKKTDDVNKELKASLEERANESEKEISETTAKAGDSNVPKLLSEKDKLKDLAEHLEHRQATTKPSTVPTTIETTTKPVTKHTTKLTIKTTPKPLTKSTTKPTIRSSTKETTKIPIIKVTTQSTVKSNNKPATKSTIKPTIKSTTMSTVKSTNKSTVKPTTKPTAKSTIKPTIKSIVKSTTKPSTAEEFSINKAVEDVEHTILEHPENSVVLIQDALRKLHSLLGEIESEE